MAIGPDELLAIVGRLHDGVVDEVTWQAALGTICAGLDVEGFMVGAVGHDGKHVRLSFSHRAASHAIALLEGPLADPAHNPWLTLAPRHPIRRVLTVEDVGGQAYLETTRVWRDFYVPMQFGAALGAVLERQPEGAQCLITGRHVRKPDFDAAERRMLGVLLPHIARAWRAKAMLAEMRQEIGTLTAILDRLERAIVVTGPGGEVRFANRSADRLLTRADALDARGGRLRAKRLRDTSALESLIGRAAKTAVGEGAVAVDAVALPSDSEHPPLAVVAEPIAPAHGDCLGQGSAAGAILFIGDSEVSRCPPADRLGIVYGLTPAEARLAASITEGNGLSRAADMLNISPNTAKFHLKAVFGKVGVSSQAQLVRRVLADVGGLAEPDKLLPRPQARCPVPRTNDESPR